MLDGASSDSRWPHFVVGLSIPASANLGGGGRKAECGFLDVNIMGATKGSVMSGFDVEFTDRYGGNIPSWLRGCHGDCEAMGVVPVKRGDSREPWATLWAQAERAEPSDDGWHFVRCPSCHGSGRVSWFMSVLRIPRWLYRASRMAWMFTTHPDILQAAPACGNA